MTERDGRVVVKVVKADRFKTAVAFPRDLSARMKQNLFRRMRRNGKQLSLVTNKNFLGSDGRTFIEE